jgi:glycosyltransferase involved in cell wall biosynthesis
LVVEALAFTTPDIKVVFVGQADDSNYHETLKQRAEELGVTDRITWLGHVSEQEKFDLYAGCHMVLFPTFDEDYGYIAPEAMLSSKGVITLEDSGGALEFVLHDETGCVARPEAEALAHEMDRTWANRPLARTYGENANTRVSSMNISWDKVVECLIQT